MELEIKMGLIVELSLLGRFVQRLAFLKERPGVRSAHWLQPVYLWQKA